MTQTNEPPDPQPEDTPGLEPGGSVAPGDTPPSEAGTSGLSAPEAKLPSRRANFVIAAVLVVALIAAALALLVGHFA